MKKLISNISGGLMKVVSSMALVLAVSSASSVCFFFAHQPDVPKELLEG